ncbi:MAG: site-specific integrase [Nanoarchaeota archaeon]|nr:site-specific integrase [Nanoarchaeota archaeon]
MKKSYPEYRKLRINKEQLYNKLTNAEKKIVDDFISYCAIGSGQNKLNDIKANILQFRDIIEKPFKEINLKDLRDYLVLLNKSGRTKYTTNGTKIHVKRFLKWYFKGWSERFDELKDIRLMEAFNHEKINEGTLLTKQDIEKIMQKERNLSKKTFFISLYESGLRPIELRTLKWKNIRFNTDGDISELHIFATKTSKARTVFVKESTYYLQQLKEEVDGDYVFPSVMKQNEPISKASATLWIKGMGKKTLGRDIFPYLIRHTRATELYLNNPKVAQKFMGHKKDMSNIYTHLSSKDVKENLLQTVYKLEDVPPEEKAELIKRLEKMEDLWNKLEKNPKLKKILQVAK